MLDDDITSDELASEVLFMATAALSTAFLLFIGGIVGFLVRGFLGRERG